MMKKRSKIPKALITQSTLHRYFTYQDGQLFWRKDRGTRAKAGTRAGMMGVNGYWVIRFFGVLYTEHQLIWKYFHGDWPNDLIDHINRDRADNNIENLRDVSPSVNCANRSGYGRGPYPGVWKTEHDTYAVRIGWTDIDGRQCRKFLGTYKDLDNAVSIKRQAEAIYWP